MQDSNNKRFSAPNSFSKFMMALTFTLVYSVIYGFMFIHSWGHNNSPLPLVIFFMFPFLLPVYGWLTSKLLYKYIIKSKD